MIRGNGAREWRATFPAARCKTDGPTRENIVSLTYAFHAAALRKGEYMYRGSFSIEDKDGSIARWLDRAEDVYLRTLTQAKTYQSLRVDGHLLSRFSASLPLSRGNAKIPHRMAKTESATP